MTATLESGFESKLREALLADAEQTLREDLGPALVDEARQRWQSYARRNDYDIAFIWEDATIAVTRRRNAAAVRVEWPELSALFEFGVEPHTIEGNPLLHFYWAEMDQWITTESVNWGSVTGGIDGARAVRDALAVIEEATRA